MKKHNLYNHISPSVSDMEKDMLNYIPPGGNWTNLPDKYNSKRLDQIRETGGRTTYYGRLTLDKPSYTITTYFNRLPNGCNIHPTQKRIISIREAARLQSFPDSYEFIESKTSQYKQIGNAVPPLLGRYIAELIKPYLKNRTVFDLFAGAGGLSEGFMMEGYDLVGANELVKTYFSTYIHNHSHVKDPDAFVLGDITDADVKNKIISFCENKEVGVIVGGPPCQGFSLAGWRDPSDQRNQLFREYLEVVDRVRPEMFVMENVPGILTMQKGVVIKEIIQAFNDLGYTTVKPFVMKAEEYGVPQKRRRVILIGALNPQLDIKPKPLFSYDDATLPNPITVGEAIMSLPELKINSGNHLQEIDYRPVSVYDKLMANKISFAEFYEEQKALSLNPA